MFYAKTFAKMLQNCKNVAKLPPLKLTPYMCGTAKMCSAVFTDISDLISTELMYN